MIADMQGRQTYICLCMLFIKKNVMEEEHFVITFVISSQCDSNEYRYNEGKLRW